MEASQARVSAVGGVSYLAQKLHQFIDLSATPFGTGIFDDRQHSRGFFGEATWRATERLSLTAGARYQSDSKRRTGVLHTIPDQLLDYDKTVGAFLPKFSAAYDFTPDVRAGVMVQRAYNPGGVTLNPQCSRWCGSILNICGIMKHSSGPLRSGER